MVLLQELNETSWKAFKMKKMLLEWPHGVLSEGPFGGMDSQNQNVWFPPLVENVLAAPSLWEDGESLGISESGFSLTQSQPN
jgi:hypothetical protein